MQSSKTVIRPIVACDKPSAAAVWLRASSIAHPFFKAAQLAEQQQLVRDVYLEKAETWVAVVAGEVVGFIGILVNWIGGLFVAPECQGQGV
ncbi:GNAT family N-acetyltransferase [Mesorhizobium sp. CAU 1741]|uniref:GNAT family N-acetyltransferase n=1 Tax=Mesorhizobium sp. CAU 1741 TaxID=3140366 RepID=UPI00325C2E26